MRKIICLVLSFCLVLAVGIPVAVAQKTPQSGQSSTYTLPTESNSLALNCKSAVLMDAATGAVLYVQNPHEALPPASVTKVMTLLLVMEAIDEGRISLGDSVSASATAVSMGGSQIYLEEGERMSVEDLLKSVVISSANDAAVALAEFVSGDLNTFIKQMNEKAAALGMSDTVFENVTGLDDTAQNHLTSAMDIAIMSRELIKHDTILKYSAIWMDTIRGGAFGLTNTNRLVRFYPGATGLKTGSTSKAGFCVSATAERDGLSLICVIMGAESRDIRNAQATKLLDWGFANFSLYHAPRTQLPLAAILGGVSDRVEIESKEFSCVLPKGTVTKVATSTYMNEPLKAPVKEGDVVGYTEYTLDGKVIGKGDIVAVESVRRMGYLDLWLRLLSKVFLA